MSAHRSVHVLAFAGVALLAAFGAGGAVSAQEDTTTTTQLDLDGGDSSSTTSTTQLDLDGGEGSTTTSPEATTTTQLDLGQQDAATTTTTTTQVQVAGDAVTGGVAPPTRVDAGAGGAAGTDQPSMASVLLAAGLVAATGAAATRVHRSTRA